MSYRIFISSTRKDIELARDVYKRLKDAKLNVIPVQQTVGSGDNIITSIHKELADADEVIAILTSNSIESQRLISEIGMAYSLDKRVTPITVGVKQSEIPPIIRSVQTVKYSDLPKYISELEKRAKAA